MRCVIIGHIDAAHLEIAQTGNMHKTIDIQWNAAQKSRHFQCAKITTALINYRLELNLFSIQMWPLIFVMQDSLFLTADATEHVQTIGLGFQSANFYFRKRFGNIFLNGGLCFNPPIGRQRLQIHNGNCRCWYSLSHSHMYETFAPSIEDVVLVSNSRNQQERGIAHFHIVQHGQFIAATNWRNDEREALLETRYSGEKSGLVIEFHAEQKVRQSFT